MTKNARQGFTLIEILIVVAIIAILASVVLVGLGPTQQAGRDSRRLSDLREVQNGLELYYNKCGYYPGGAVAASCAGVAHTADATWAAMTTALEGSAIGVPTVPNDPTSGKTYFYGTDAGGDSYVIAATLEQLTNSVFNSYTVVNLTTPVAYTATGLTSCAAPNYCITL
ncbi:MAG TPA: prepilin-type N-terminal cleavage/methylation domain-containing protein [Candidatus Paceibacterota bacterium]|jgi:prepilin-type N-terminal cleavage/methylation domain-containing protein|nr:prepilin-type N-terminal cleavage/methylation domain-containing protein [Candidatus Paceibacterota bacterium]